MCVCSFVSLFVCVCVRERDCVCVRKRERERERDLISIKKEGVCRLNTTVSASVDSFQPMKERVSERE